MAENILKKSEQRVGGLWTNKKNFSLVSLESERQMTEGAWALEEARTDVSQTWPKG